MMKQFKPILWASAGIAVVAVFGTALFLRPKADIKRTLAQVAPHNLLHRELDRREIAQMIGEKRLFSQDLEKDFYPVKDKKGEQLQVHFTLDKDLQKKIESLYDRYDPAFAAFVAMDPDTGKILALVDHSQDGHEGNLALKSSYPAASVFKVVTSAAALGEGKIRPNSRFPVNGRFSTLYKSNLRDTVNRWTRYITIEEAFAKSVNTVFGKIAMTRVGPQTMQKYANGFGFNQHLDFDMPIDMGAAIIPVGDEFGLAESGSGYTRRQTLNPIQGAMIAAGVINGGRIPAPLLVESVKRSDGTSAYQAEANPDLFKPIDKETAKSLSLIMEHTITQGTARKEFRDYNHHPVLSNLFIGAKTGSLSGLNPAGRYDWFVGFAQSSANPKRKIVFASMIVNRKYWRVKSSHIAREAIIEYFANKQGI